MSITQPVPDSSTGKYKLRLLAETHSRTLHLAHALLLNRLLRPRPFVPFLDPRIRSGPCSLNVREFPALE